MIWSHKDNIWFVYIWFKVVINSANSIIFRWFVKSSVLPAISREYNTYIWVNVSDASLKLNFRLISSHICGLYYHFFLKKDNRNFYLYVEQTKFRAAKFNDFFYRKWFFFMLNSAQKFLDLQILTNVEKQCWRKI